MYKSIIPLSALIFAAISHASMFEEIKQSVKEQKVKQITADSVNSSGQPSFSTSSTGNSREPIDTEWKSVPITGGGKTKITWSGRPATSVSLNGIVYSGHYKSIPVGINCTQVISGNYVIGCYYHKPATRTPHTTTVTKYRYEYKLVATCYEYSGTGYMCASKKGNYDKYERKYNGRWSYYNQVAIKYTETETTYTTTPAVTVDGRIKTLYIEQR